MDVQLKWKNLQDGVPAHMIIYKMGDILHNTKIDLVEISTTMNLGGDEWLIYLENKKMWVR